MWSKLSANRADGSFLFGKSYPSISEPFHDEIKHSRIPAWRPNL